ncbi:MAG TPA: LamG domain-containing protein, partial [Anaerolineae bacterium]
MLRIHRGLSVLIVVALLAAVLGEALPVNAASSLPSVSPGLQETAAPRVPYSSSSDALGETVVMTSTLDAPTASGPSLYLNGASYVSVPHASLPAIDSGDFTLEAWIYPTTVTGFHAVMAKWYSVGFWFGLYNGKLRFYRGSGSFVETTASIPINRWTHIAVASYYEPYSGSYLAEFYINGDREGVYEHFGAAA